MAIYDGKSFVYLSRNEGLLDNQVHFIQEDKKGTVWLTTLTGVSSNDGVSVKKYTNTNMKNPQNSFEIRSNIPLEGNWMKTDHDLWFDTGSKEGIYRFDEKNDLLGISAS